MRIAVVVAALSLCGLSAPGSVRAQRLPEPRFPVVQLALADSSEFLATGHAMPSCWFTRDDYRTEGAIAGAVLLGALGVWVGWESCRSGGQPEGSAAGRGCTGNAVAVGLVSSVAGAGLGYLVGWMFPKARPEDERAPIEP
jgi:hypothetical protein